MPWPRSSRAAANALELARNGVPKAPFYVTGRIAVLEKEVAACGRTPPGNGGVRASQRTIGLTASPPAAAKSPAKACGKVAGGTAAVRRQRCCRQGEREAPSGGPGLESRGRIAGRAEVQETPADSSLAEKAEMVQRSVASSSLATAEAANALPAVSEA